MNASEGGRNAKILYQMHNQTFKGKFPESFRSCGHKS